MAKVSLNTFGSFVNDLSAVAKSNANNQRIATALENTLSRDGTSPNEMNAPLDMNNNEIVNARNIKTDVLTVGDVIFTGLVDPAYSEAIEDLSDELTSSTSALTSALAVDVANLELVKDDTNVKGYGAIVDGSTNDSVSFVTSLTAKNIVKLAVGTSFLSSAIALGTNQCIKGDGALSKILTGVLGSGRGTIEAGGTNISVRDIHLTVPSSSHFEQRGIQLRNVIQGEVKDSTIVTSVGGQSPIHIDRNATNVTISGNTLFTPYIGILVKPNVSAPDILAHTYAAKNVKITNNLVKGTDDGNDFTGTVGISLDGDCEGGIVANNVVENFLGHLTTPGIGIGIANDSTVHDRSSGITVASNFVKNCDYGLYSEDAHNGINWLANNVHDCGTGHQINTGENGSASGLDGDPKSIHIISNQYRRLQNAGLQVSSTDPTAAPSFLDISHNTVDRWGLAGASNGIVIYGANSTKVNIDSNSLYGGVGHGINLESSAKAKISKNIIDTTGYGLKFAGTPTSSILVESNNTLSGASLGPVDLTGSLDGISGDKDILSEEILMDESASSYKVIHHFRRAAFLCRVGIVFLDAPVGASSRVFYMGINGGITILNGAVLGTMNPQYSLRNLAFDTAGARVVPAGSTLTTLRNVIGDGDYRIKVLLNYFYYD